MTDQATASQSTTPLAGRRIVVTRARAQAAALVGRLHALGAEVIEFPTIEIRPPVSLEPLDSALKKIAEYRWLIFTSVNSVSPVRERLEALGMTTADFDHLQVAAIGPETARRLQRWGLTVALLPDKFQAEGILEGLKPENIRGKKILLPRAAVAREVLPETLRRWGAVVDVVTVYETGVPNVDATGLERRLERAELDAITFTSSSTVRNFHELMGARPLGEVLGPCAIACIGPITAETVIELGGNPTMVAESFTTDGLVESLVRYFSARR